MARKRVAPFLAAAVLVSAIVVALPGVAQAHGDCSIGTRDEGRSFIAGWINLSTGRAIGQTGFRCAGGEVHAKIVVDVRFWRCPRRTVTECVGGDAGWTIVKDRSETCKNASLCGLTKYDVDCVGTNSLVYVYGRWVAYDSSGAKVHKSPDYPAYTPQLGQWLVPYEDCQ